MYRPREMCTQEISPQTRHLELPISLLQLVSRKVIYLKGLSLDIIPGFFVRTCTSGLRFCWLALAWFKGTFCIELEPSPAGVWPGGGPGGGTAHSCVGLTLVPPSGG